MTTFDNGVTLMIICRRHLCCHDICRFEPSGSRRGQAATAAARGLKLAASISTLR